MYGITVNLNYDKLPTKEIEQTLYILTKICSKYDLVKENEYSFMLFQSVDPLTKIYSVINEIKQSSVNQFISRLIVLNIKDYNDFTEYLKL